jgi:hypothetical protein
LKRTKQEAAYRAFKRQVIDLAYRRYVAPKAGTCHVNHMPTGATVFAVWQSTAELDGVGVLIVKGQKLLPGIVKACQPLPKTCAVIWCIDYSQAVALRGMQEEDS